MAQLTIHARATFASENKSGPEAVGQTARSILFQEEGVLQFSISTGRYNLYKYDEGKLQCLIFKSKKMSTPSTVGTWSTSSSSMTSTAAKPSINGKATAISVQASKPASSVSQTIANLQQKIVAGQQQQQRPVSTSVVERKSVVSISVAKSTTVTTVTDRKSIATTSTVGDRKSTATAAAVGDRKSMTESATFASVERKSAVNNGKISQLKAALVSTNVDIGSVSMDNRRQPFISQQTKDENTTDDGVFTITYRKEPAGRQQSLGINQLKVALEKTNLDIAKAAVSKPAPLPAARGYVEEDENPTREERPRAAAAAVAVARPTSDSKRMSLAGSRADEFRSVCNVPALDLLATKDLGREMRSSIPRLVAHLKGLALGHCSAIKLRDEAHVNFAVLRVLYRWVAQNIAYDIVSLYAGTVTHQKCQPEYVLRAGMGVCSGYCRLLKAMADCAGLTMRCTSGWAKGAGYTVGDIQESQVIKSDHEWNIVTLDGEDYHLDVTWSAGHTNGKSFNREWNEHYFLTPAELFVQDHLPIEAEEQLISPPMSLNEYCVIPAAKPAFFAAGMQPKGENSTSGVLRAIAGSKFEMDFAIRHDWEVLTPVLARKENGGDDSCGSVRRISDTHTKVLVDVPSSRGEYVLTLFAKSKQARSGNWAVQYLIRVE